MNIIDSLGTIALLSLVRSTVPKVASEKLTITALLNMEIVEDLVNFLDESMAVSNMTEQV